MKIVRPDFTNSALAGTCRTHFVYPVAGLLSRAYISFTGNISNMPSVSNRRLIRSMGGKIINIKNPDHQKHFQRMTDLYFERLRSGNFPSFGSDLVHMELLLSARNNRKDPHNIPKGLCDWLQSIKLVSNDKNIRSLQVKMMADHDDQMAFDTTVIVLCLKQLAHDASRSLTDAAIGSAALWGDDDATPPSAA